MLRAQLRCRPSALLADGDENEGVVVLTAAAGTARAENACNPAIEKTKSDWQAIRLEPASKISKGVGAHAGGSRFHEISSKYHLATAMALCKDGKDHEALLHVGVVRAFLTLPQSQHPTDHRHLFKGEQK